MHLRIATRQSQLALAQTQQVVDYLKRQNASITTDIIKVVSQGDQIQDKPLAEFGGKGLFIKGLEAELMAERADVAMHSLKDVPPYLEAEFALPFVLKRQSPFDVLVARDCHNLSELPKGAIIGTSSVRRQAALLHTRPDLVVKMVRGNIHTRLRKLDEGQFDAIILAEAGLRRVGLAGRITQVLDPQSFVPSVGQGVIAVECLKARTDLIELLKRLNDEATYARITAERSMNRQLQASCTSPVGSYATINGNSLHLTGVVWQQNGGQRLETQQTGPVEQAEVIGQTAGQDLLQQGAAALLSEQ